MTDLATLVVRLEAETSKYQTQLQAATKQLEGFQQSVTDVVHDLTAKFAALFTADKILEFVESAIEGAAAIERLSQSVGIGVEQLSSLSAAAAQSGVSQDEMATSLKKLNVAISDAAGNASSKAAFAFKALGISVTDSNGSLKTAGQILPELADAYSKLADGPNKVAINTDVLGKSAQNLIPLLNQGARGLQDLQDAAVASGAALTSDVAEAADNLEKKFIALKQSAVGTLSTEVLQATIPTLNAFADGLADIAKQGTSTNLIMQVFSAVLGVIGAVILEIDGELKELGSALDGVANAADAAVSGIGKALGDAFRFDSGAVLRDLSNTGDDVTQILDDQSAEAQKIYETKNAAIERILNNGSKTQVEIADETAKLVSEKFEKAFDGLNSGLNVVGVSPQLLAQLDQAQKKIEDFAASIKVQAQSFDLGAVAQTSFKLSTGSMGDALKLAQKQFDDITTKGVTPFTQAAYDSAKATLDAAAAARQYSVSLQAKIDAKEVQDYTDKLQKQVEKFGESDVAALDFANTTGKLGKALDDTADHGEAARKHLHDLAVELTDDKDKAAVFGLDQQILTLGQHLEQAAVSGFKFQNALLIKNVAATGNVADQERLDTLQTLTQAQGKYNDLVVQFQRIQADEAIQEANINRLVSAGTESKLDGQREISEDRLKEVNQLTDVYNGLKAISDQNAATMPGLVDRTKQFGNAINGVAAATHELADKLRNDFENSASDAFASFVTGAESASQAAHQFLTSFTEEIVKLATNKAFEDLFSATGQTGGGGIFGLLAGFLGGGNGLSTGANAAIATSESSNVTDALALLGGGVAHGGPVNAGMSYTVGEHGAEEFVPDVPGTIIPNSKMSKGDTYITNISVAAPRGTVSRQTLSQTAAAAGDGVSRAQRRIR